ncbi:UNVERIFIED_CONTAM: hypothetical protein HHA_454540 [Hammondia hammondi]|eukprot:XP_008888115.1 hypothetical protein HHA_454540 [Hammondia hammondi]
MANVSRAFYGGEVDGSRALHRTTVDVDSDRKRSAVFVPRRLHAVDSTQESPRVSGPLFISAVLYMLFVYSLSSVTSAAEEPGSVSHLHQKECAHSVQHRFQNTQSSKELSPFDSAAESFASLTGEEIAAVHAHLVWVLSAGVTPKTASESSSPPAFRCLVSGRLQSHTFPARGPSLVVCCGANAARTLAVEKGALKLEENRALLPLLVALQEQFESLDYEEKLRAFTQKVGNLYDFVRKTDTRMHGLLAHHQETGRPLLPAKEDVKFLPFLPGRNRCTRRGIRTLTGSASPCSSLGFPRAQAIAAARAAVELIASFAFPRSPREKADSRETENSTNPTHEASGVEGGWRPRKVNNSLSGKKGGTKRDAREGAHRPDPGRKSSETDSVAGVLEREKQTRAFLHQTQEETPSSSSAKWTKKETRHASKEGETENLSGVEETRASDTQLSLEEERRDPSSVLDLQKATIKAQEAETQMSKSTLVPEAALRSDYAISLESTRETSEQSAAEELNDPRSWGDREERKEDMDRIEEKRLLTVAEDDVSRLTRLLQASPTNEGVPFLRNSYKLVQRATEALLRLHVVDVEETCILTAAHFSKEQSRQQQIRRKEIQTEKKRRALEERTH